MKKIIVLSTLLMCAVIGRAQYGVINNVTVIPLNPTTNDTVKVASDCTLGQYGCPLYNSTISITGNTIYVDAYYCQFVLTVLCNATDTFVIGTLPAGTYTLNFNLHTSLPDFNCPGSTPMVLTDSSANTFTVSIFSGIAEIEQGNNFYYDALNNEIILKGNFNADEIVIRDYTGKICYQNNRAGKQWKPGNLETGIYFITFRKGEKYFGGKFVRAL